MASSTPLFHRPLHTKYWLRCLKSPLPHHYTSNDANRMTLAFFTLSALDLLGVLDDPAHIAPPARAAYADWIYHCQHPGGGFRGFPGTDFGERASDANAVWDPANLPATYFALATLAVLGDGFARVRRRECLVWLRKLQRPDGSFGETVGAGGAIEGGSDARFGYCAAAVRWMLRGTAEGSVDGVEDLDVDRLARCIRQSETYDGGIADAPFHEPHGRLPTNLKTSSIIPVGHPEGDHDVSTGLTSVDATIKWLLSRQTSAIDEEEDEDEDQVDHDSNGATSDVVFEKIRSIPVNAFNPALATSFLDNTGCPCTGFAGRVNKIADTCYAFWVGGALKILDNLHLIDLGGIRRYLLEKTQHPILGGFSKVPGDPPDVYHAYMGLAIFSLVNEELARSTVAEPSSTDIDIRRLDPNLCFSVKAKEWIESLEWRKQVIGDALNKA